MKLLRRPVEVIAWFDLEGNLVPVKFRYYDESEEAQVIKVDRVVKKDMDRFAGNKMIKYTCESLIDGQLKPFEIRYEIDSCRWFLYKV